MDNNGSHEMIGFGEVKGTYLIRIISVKSVLHDLSPKSILHSTTSSRALERRESTTVRDELFDLPALLCELLNSCSCNIDTHLSAFKMNFHQ